MDKDNSLVQVTPDDLSYIEKELAASRRPATTRDLAAKLAFLKTADDRTREVKIYDPGCVYEAGDTIFKEYDEDLTVGAKVHERFQGAVVLTVIRKTFYDVFGCEMLEVDYTGGGVFRKYVDYMKKAKAQVLLPSNVDGANRPPRIMPREEDPRLTELPMTGRDLKALERNLKAALSKAPAFFTWSDWWQLAAAQPAIPETKIREVEAYISAARASAPTTDLVRALFGLEPSHDLFDLHCLSLNHVLETKHRKEFIPVQSVGWGQWHLKALLTAMPAGLPLSAPAAAVRAIEGPDTIPITPFHDFPLKVYLGWREILSGGVKIPKSFNKELAHAREYIFTDAEEKKSLTVHFFPQQGYFLGLKEYFEVAAIPQGTSMTLEKTSPVQFNFWLKKSKKKIQVAKVAYDTTTDTFTEAGETASLAMPNKIIYLERDQIQKLTELVPLRDGLDLKDLLVLVFKTFSYQSANFSLHYLRAYHLVDILRRTTQEDVEFILLNSPEFEKSDKKKGIFYYREAALEVPVEAPAPAALEAAAEAPEPIEDATEFPEHEFTVIEESPVIFTAAVPTAPPAVSAAEAAALAEAEAELEAFEADKRPKADKGPDAAPAPKKDKDKKKIRSESDRRPKTRKSERRVLEEEIIQEESEREALFAEKVGEDELLELPVEPPAAGTEPEIPVAPAKPASAGPLGGGLFAEKLKVALKKKREEAAPEDMPEPDEGRNP